MTDHIRLEPGAPPWSPTHDSHLESVVHHFTIPLIGVIDQRGTKYVFWCIYGEAADGSVWVYSLVQEDHVARLGEASGMAQIRDVLHEITQHGGVMACLATEDDGILIEANVDPGIAFGDDSSPALAALVRRVKAVAAGSEGLMESTDAFISA